MPEEKDLAHVEERLRAINTFAPIIRTQLTHGRMQILVLPSALASMGLGHWAEEYKRGTLERAPLFYAAEELAEIRAFRRA